MVGLFGWKIGPSKVSIDTEDSTLSYRRNTDILQLKFEPKTHISKR
jgi:hypothetical protein